MAAPSNPATNSHSPRSSGDGATINSPKSRRARGVSSPWTQIVRGAESESVVSLGPAGAAVAPSSPSSSSAVQEQNTNSPDWPPSQAEATVLLASPDDFAVDAQPESSDNAAKKPAWNKPSNCAVEEVGPVMGAVSWPALSESTRASPKSSSDSLKILSDGSLLASQGTGIASSSSHKQVIANNASPNSTPKHGTQPRPRSMKRGGGGGGSSSGVVSANGGFPQPPSPQGSVVEMAPNNSGKPGSTGGESSPRDHSHKEGGQRGGLGSQSHSGNDHQQQRNSFRRGNGGQHPRGDGSFHHGYGGRRDHDHGNQDWNPHRNFNSRDTHMQPQRVVPRGFIRPPPQTSAPFIPPPPVPMRPFGNPLGYPDMGSSVIYVQGPPPESLRVPIVAPIPPHAMFFPVPDHQLHSKIVNQIDYYFSNENLVKDTFLRRNMDDQGWVPINLIAGFKKVKILTENFQLILDSVRTSTVVEVQGDKVRRRNDWMRWIMPNVTFSAVSSPQSLGMSSQEMLAAHLQGVALDEKTTKHGHAEMFFSRSSSGEFNSQLQQSGGEGTGQVIFQAGFESSTLAGNSSK